MTLTRRTFAIGLLPGLAGAQEGHFNQSPVFSAGDHGYHTFRIPALLLSGSGVLLAFAEGRRFGRGDSGAIDLVLKRSTDSGATWSALQVVWSDGSNTCGNPCPVVDSRNGRILLPMTWNSGKDNGRELHHGTGTGTRRVFLMYSDDDGRNWSSAREITGQAKRPDWWWYATGPGAAIQIRNGEHSGRIVVPANHTSEKDGYAAHAILSDDGGENWRMSSVIAPACNESQVVELVDGRLMMNSRNQSLTNEERTGYRAIAFSADGGETWTAATLQDPVYSQAFTRFRLPWRWDGNECVLLSRCRDETGYVQPSREELIAERGRFSAYHCNRIKGWEVATDGGVSNAEA